jgi:hypothetical protein
VVAHSFLFSSFSIFRLRYRDIWYGAEVGSLEGLFYSRKFLPCLNKSSSDLQHQKSKKLSPHEEGTIFLLSTKDILKLFSPVLLSLTVLFARSKFQSKKWKCTKQCCQMVYVFEKRKIQFSYFLKKPWCGQSWIVSRPYDIFCAQLGYFLMFWYVVPWKNLAALVGRIQKGLSNWDQSSVKVAKLNAFIVFM